MHRPSLSSPSFFYASTLATVLLLTCVLFLRALLTALASDSLAAYLSLLSSSPWARATLADYLTGALILATWLGTRTTPPLLLPHALYAAALPFLGNPVAYTHTALTLLLTRTPFSIAPRNVAPPGALTPYAERTRKAYIGFASAVGSAYFGVLLHAFAAEDLMAGLHGIKGSPLLLVTFYDNLMGIGMAVVIIFAREASVGPAVVWAVAMGLLGHGVFCIYAVTVGLDARRWGTSVGDAWATCKAPAVSAYV